MAKKRRTSGARKAPAPKKRADDEDDDKPRRPRPFWSGTLTFGLVSLPVGLYPAHQGSAVSLRMVDADGTRLRRRYRCSHDDKLLDSEELVRGFETEEGRFITVEDEELEALAPKKSREIDLRQFVQRDELDPVYFLRGYFLTPEEGAVKAYRLLARSMEQTDSAGIATFVMRGHEYLVAILAEQGILRAETLRFADTLRSPADIGLPDPGKARASDIQRLQGAIKALRTDTPPEEALQDQDSAALEALARRKLEQGEDVLQRAPEIVEDEEDGEAPPDLMAVLKQSLAVKEAPPAPRKKKRARPDAYADATRAQLYAMAQERGIPGRSRMDRAALAAALRDTED